jgi:Ulp1 family protease
MKFDTTILVPANVQANHWVLFVVELALGKIQLYDPKAQVGLS